MDNNFDQEGDEGDEGDEGAKKTRNSRVLEEMKTYYVTPNAYADLFMSYLKSDEWKLVSYACRRIFGFHVREDHISVSQFVHGAMMYDGSGYRDRGTGLSKNTVTRGLAYLNQVRLMKIMASNNPIANKGVLWSLELDYNKVDIKALVERRERILKANRDRMKKTRAGRKEQLS